MLTLVLIVVALFLLAGAFTNYRERREVFILFLIVIVIALLLFR